MSLVTQINSLITRIGTEFKSVRAAMGNHGSLTTTDKSSLVNAIIEVNAKPSGGGGTTAFSGLTTDVAISSPATGHIPRYNATTNKWENVLGSTYFDTAGLAAAAQAAAIAASQPVDTDLTAISALTTQTYGRSLLTLANQAALNAAIAPSSETVVGTVELATLAEMAVGTDPLRVATVAGVRQERTALKAEILGAGVPAALDTLDELAAALADDANFAASVTTSLAGRQPLDTDLTAIAALVSASDKMLYATGAGTWALTTVTSAARGLLDDVNTAAMLVTLGAAASADMGDPNTDFVAAFNAALV